MNKSISVGGLPQNTFYLIMVDRFKTYINALEVGVNEKDAYFYAYVRIDISLNVLLTFKALVPIIGYTFAKFFIIDQMNLLDIERVPHFLKITSKLYSHGYNNIDKCIMLINYPSNENIERFLSLRPNKRKHIDYYN
jgi:hypothetical protein